MPTSLTAGRHRPRRASRPRRRAARRATAAADLRRARGEGALVGGGHRRRRTPATGRSGPAGAGAGGRSPARSGRARRRSDDDGALRDHRLRGGEQARRAGLGDTRHRRADVDRAAGGEVLVRCMTTRIAVAVCLSNDPKRVFAACGHGPAAVPARCVRTGQGCATGTRAREPVAQRRHERGVDRVRHGRLVVLDVEPRRGQPVARRLAELHRDDRVEPARARSAPAGPRGPPGRRPSPRPSARSPTARGCRRAAAAPGPSPARGSSRRPARSRRARSARRARRAARAGRRGAPRARGTTRGTSPGRGSRRAARRTSARRRAGGSAGRAAARRRGAPGVERAQQRLEVVLVRSNSSPLLLLVSRSVTCLAVCRWRSGCSPAASMPDTPSLCATQA